MKPQAITVQIEYAPAKTITLETGRLAKQAGGAVIMRAGDTMVLATAVISDSARPGQNFFPLTVDYREKFSSGGKIPGGFIKREGRLNDKEILTSRLVDRAIRPLFPEGFLNEVQLIGSVISADGDNDGDMLFGIGASAALLLSGSPFDGPIVEVRIGRIDSTFIVNPTVDELRSSDFNLVVAGKIDSIMMVEGEMSESSEEDIVEALTTAHQVIKKICQAQLDLRDQFEAIHGPIESIEYELDTPESEMVERVRNHIQSKIESHIRAPYEKKKFYGGLSDLIDEAVETISAEFSDEDDDSIEYHIRSAASVVSRDAMREMVLSDRRRIDGRDPESVRPIWCEAGYLPRVHGSSIFTRGETQVMASVTLGTTRDQQPVDQVFDQEDKHFFLHYEFPPFSTGEVKFLRGASRREIGHGYLAERALQGMIPDQEEFPYTIRINADVLESNGSSSMASVCSGSLALMDAGVPIRKAIAGVAMGMVADETRHVVLTDILGTEDHLGDMDFKVTGTRDGITACQMDIKISGLSRDVMLQALQQARDARLHILDVMDQTLQTPRDQMSPHAPRLTQITIDSDLIGAVIGPGGKTVRGIQADTGVIIEVEERDNLGYVTIAGSDERSVEQAIEIIHSLVVMPEIGEEYDGTVRSVTDIGVIVEILPGKEGMVHKSELSWEWVTSPHDFVQVGDKLRVRLMEIRDRGRLRLSHKVTVPRPANYRQNSRPPRGAPPHNRGNRRGGHSRGPRRYN
ncbi:MAG: polyribonucleotide nucleotidyltransferase [Bacteroidetes bacterium]|nr:polyribonucleotide nucleotidyltransferase [Bacteroidota bacterium]MCY4232714.1 polyribonucleotide nucleotidyltransferase [Bacteroidota bacterium]